MEVTLALPIKSSVGFPSIAQMFSLTVAPEADLDRDKEVLEASSRGHSRYEVRGTIGLPIFDSRSLAGPLRQRAFDEVSIGREVL